MNLGQFAIYWFILLLKLSWWPVKEYGYGMKRTPFCPSLLKVSTLYLPPYVLNSSSGDPEGIIGDFFMETLDKCLVQMCAPNVTRENFRFEMFFSTEAFASWIRDNKSDLFFPISRPLKVVLSGDDYTGPPLDFRSVVSSPKYSLIKDVEIYNRDAKIIVVKTLFENAWPIVVFTVLIAGISGVCVWILETYYNEEEFPRSFIQGTYEGFWWAFVTMTTVGYGDKTPRFVFGRLFGVLWILTGLVVIAMFTATTTGALSISSAGLPGVQGIRVGVLANTSAELVAKQNGAQVTLLAPFDELYDALKRRDIDGILIDGYRAAYYLHHKNDSSVRVFQNVDSEIIYYFAAPSSILSVMTDHESCFKRHIENLHVDHLVMEYLKPMKAYRPEIDSESLVSGESRSTRDFLLVTMGIFVGLILLGTVTEFVYKKVWRPNKRVQNGHEDINLKEIRLQPDTTNTHLKDVGDKIEKLICEVGKLQQQVSAIASQGDGTCGSEQTTSNMIKEKTNGFQLQYKKTCRGYP